MATTKNNDAPCIVNAWQAHAQEIRQFLIKRLRSEQNADDVLQVIFYKALKHRQTFCALEQPRAWLYSVAKTSVIDFERDKNHRTVDISLLERAEETSDESDVFTSLQACIVKALPQLDKNDRDILNKCDLSKMPQAEYAKDNNLKLSAVKARLRRARERLRQQLIQQCSVEWDKDGYVCCFRSVTCEK